MKKTSVVFRPRMRSRMRNVSGALVLLAITSASGFSQRVQNPGFESGSWSGWYPWFPSQGSVTVGNVAHSGSYGVTMGPTDGGEVAAQDITGLTPGQSYLVSAWVMAVNGTTAPVELDLFDQLTNGSYVIARMTAGSSWQQISQIYTADWAGGLRINLVEDGGSAGTYWDDVKVTPVSGSVRVGGSLWPQYPAKEYIYLNGKAVVIENVPH